MLVEQNRRRNRPGLDRSGPAIPGRARGIVAAGERLAGPAHHNGLDRLAPFSRPGVVSMAPSEVVGMGLRSLGFALAAALGATTAHADLRISTNATSNVTCSDGVCTATAAK